MIAGKHPLTIRRGDTLLPVVFTFKGLDGAPIDLTGASVYAEIRAGSRKPLILDLQPQITDAEAGQITITLEPEVTAPLPAGNFRWSLVVVLASGERITIIEDAAEILPEITEGGL